MQLVIFLDVFFVFPFTGIYVSRRLLHEQSVNRAGYQANLH